MHREPRHSCTRKQILLRHKAAPAPGTRDYEAFVELVSFYPLNPHHFKAKKHIYFSIPTVTNSCCSC